MSLILYCDGCSKPIDPLEDDYLHVEATYYGHAVQPVRLGQNSLDFHNGDCLLKFEWQDWPKMFAKRAER
jgi:hypothetical protein